MSTLDAALEAAASPAPPPPRKPAKLSLLQKLDRRVRSDPLVFGFLGLTVVALTGGMVSLLRNDKKQSQLMMRARVAFQLCTISALVGGIYYRAYSGSLASPAAVAPVAAAEFAAGAGAHLLAPSAAAGAGGDGAGPQMR